MSQNILTTNTVCVDTIHSDSNLDIYSNRKIHFDTPNMLVRTLHFNKHIDNVVFGASQTDTPYAYKVNSISENEIDISQMGEYELEMVDCLEVSSKQSYQDVSGVNKEHYVNLSADNDLIIRSENIFVENESFDDYVYRLVNNKTDPNINSETTPTISIVPSNRYNVTDFGTYFTNTIQCNKVSTENIYITSSGTNEEPVLNINSRSAVNLQSLNIFIDDSNTGSTVDLDTYLKTRLDESGMFTITIIPESGVNIGFTYDQYSVGNGFSNNYNSITAFNYIINFKIVPTGQTPTDGASTNVLHEVRTPSGSDSQLSITHDNTPSTRYELTNLEAGAFYDIYADVTNNFTSTIVYNVPTNGTNIPTIEHVVINSVMVVNEKEIEIKFMPHATQIANWNTPEKKVRFYVRLDEVNAVANNYLLPDSTPPFIEVNLSTPSRSEETYTIDVTKYNGYPSEYIYVNSSNLTHPHSFSIVSRHTNYPTSSFEMITPVPQSLNPLFQFNAPAQPSNLQLDLDETNLFTWTQSSNDTLTTKLTRIFYDIFRDGHASRLNSSNLENVGVCNSYTNVLQNMDSNLNDNRNLRQGIIPGTYNIQAYNLFDQRSGFAPKTITALTVSKPTWSVPSSANKQWTISYNVTGNNGAFSILSNKSAVGGSIPDEATSFLTELEIDTHTVYVEAEDTAMRVISLNSDPIPIVQPTITIGTLGTYVSSSARHFSFPISLNTPSYVGATINSISNASSLSNCTHVSSASNSITVQVNNSSSNINISFSTNAVDSYGYTSLNASKINHTISVTFTLPTILCSNRAFSLSSTTGLSGFQWKKDGINISGATSGTTSSNLTLPDNDQYFGDISCSYTIVNIQGFTKTDSSSITNPTPTLTGGSFTITGPSSYTPSFTTSYTQVGSLRVMKSGSTQTNYSSAGTYTLQVKLKNNLGFSKWVDVGTDTVTTPTAASFTFTKTQTSITVNNISYGTNGTPSETPTIKLYYSTSSFTTTSLPSSPQPVTLTGSETSKAVNGLQMATTYYFMIVKDYPNYGIIHSTLENTSTIADARAFLTQVVDLEASATSQNRKCRLQYKFPFVDQSYISTNVNRVEIWTSTETNYFITNSFANRNNLLRNAYQPYQARLTEVYDESIPHLYKIHTNSSLSVTQDVTVDFTTSRSAAEDITFAVRVFLNDGTYQTFIPGTWTWNLMQIAPQSSYNQGFTCKIVFAPSTDYPVRFYVCRRFTTGGNYTQKIIYIANPTFDASIAAGSAGTVFETTFSSAIGVNPDDASESEWDILVAKREWTEYHNGTPIRFKFVSNQIRVGLYSDSLGPNAGYHRWYRPEVLSTDEINAVLTNQNGTITL